MKRRRSGTTVTVYRTVSIDCAFTCRVSGGEKAHGPTLSSPGYPGSDPEVEIVAIESDSGTDLSAYAGELSKADTDAITEKALEEARDQESAAREDAAEARADARREAAWDERHDAIRSK